MKWRMPMAIAATMQLSRKNINMPPKKPIHMLVVISGILGMLLRWNHSMKNLLLNNGIAIRLHRAKIR